ncbi:MAG: acetate kinase [Arcobacter sp.]|nr:MAG: acetate kinase [Arcobacter sp.]
MKILVINSGSSSLKFKLFNMHELSILCSGLLENIGSENSSLRFHYQDKILEKKISIPEHNEALYILFDLIFEEGILVDISEVYGVGHRVVHGGNLFSKAIEINEEVLKSLEDFIPLAPLHNPANIAGIHALSKKAPKLRQVAVFDTAFHHNMPEYASRYALRDSLYNEDKIQRYGFHGTSHSFVFKQVCLHLNKEPSLTNIISLHLGNGASACAIKKGVSVDTSMGMTPLEGLVMGTRCGDIDPSIIFYLHRHKGYSIDEIDTLLNKNSGLLGLCGNNDIRSILSQAKPGNKYQLAIDIFVYRIKKYIGAYMAVLEDVDAIVFTGGIGENSSEIRRKVCEGLGILSIYIDENQNLQEGTKEFSFHSKESSIKLFVIPTNEELEIALQTKEVLEGLSE